MNDAWLIINTDMLMGNEYRDSMLLFVMRSDMISTHEFN